MNRKYLISLRFTFILFAIIVFVFGADAKHIVGGEVTYKVLSTDSVLGGKANYEIKFTIHRDALSGGADFDPIAYFGIYKLIDNDWQFYARFEAGVENIETIKNIYNPCFESPANIRYEKGEYILRLTLPIIDVPYQITYQRCCRTNNLVNIVDPEATGATYYIEIYPQAQIEGNSSPEFKNYPPSVLCADVFLEFDHSATDAEGDSLSYEYFTPKHGGGLAGSDTGTSGQANACNGVSPIPDENCEPPFPDVIFKYPYNSDNPIGGMPPIDLNEKTGIMYGNPTEQGQYLVGIRIKEYRNGKLIGTVQRDFQFIVMQCSPSVNAFVEDGNLIDVDKLELKYCGKDTITFINKSVKRDKIYSTNWEFDIGGEKVFIEDWDATVVFDNIGKYKGKLVLNRGLVCSDSINLEINIFPKIEAGYTFEFDSCYFEPINFVNHSYSDAGAITKHYWDFGDGQTSEEANPDVLYEAPGTYMQRLIVEDKNECKDSAYSTIDYYPIVKEMKFKPSKYLGCTPKNAEITFEVVPKFIDSSYIIKWDFGDGTTDNTPSPVHIFEEEGVYDVSLSIESPTGCLIERLNKEFIEILAGPTADFDFKQQYLNGLSTNINFTNYSEGATSYFWDFGDGGISEEFEPNYFYRDTGLYKIKLTAKSKNFCSDTIVKSIFINPEVPIFFPNAFTPNGDGKNDEFFGITQFPQFLYNFELSIWNRWGGLVFETNNPLDQWNGAIMNKGQILPQGVYVYKYSFSNPVGKKVSGKGFVTIIK